MSDVSIHVGDDGSWAVDEGTYARGTAFVDGERHDAADLVDRFGQVGTGERFRSLVGSLNGYFALIHRTDGAVYAAADRGQTTPLFYANSNGELYLSDDARWLREELGDRSRDPLAEAEFQLTGYVTGGETLYPDIRQLQAGELLAADGARDGFITDRYYRYQPSGSASGNRESFLDRLDEVVTNAFERAIEVADGRQIVVPLSGGYDSRLVVLMLDKLGYDDVVAFSYGKSWGSEHTVSRRIAEEIGVRWEYVEYTNDRWHDWFHSEERERYYDFSFNHAALPGWVNLAWPAVWELVRSGRISDDAVFMPGHTAVSPSEHFHDDILDVDSIGKERVVQFIKGVNYKLWNWDDEAFDEVLDERILRKIETDNFEAPDEAARATAEWYWQERQSKFINRDVDVYEFFDHDWWMPLWDHEFTTFWQSLPLDLRDDKALYRRYVEDLHVGHTGARIEQAQETEMSSPTRRLHRWLYHSPVFHLVRPLYARARYYADPRGWPGIMPRRQFASMFTGRQRAFSFLALEVLDKLSFDPPKNIDTPIDGRISIDLVTRDDAGESRGEGRRQRGRTTNSP